MLNKLFFSVFLFFLFSVSLFAKKEYVPYVGNETWNSLELNYKLNKFISIEYESEARIELDYEKNIKLLNTVGVGYNILKFYKLESFIRVRHKNSIPSVEYLIQGTVKYSFSNLDFKHRLRFQYKAKDVERIWRNKLELSYNFLEKFKSGINSEAFLNVYTSNYSKIESFRHSIFLEYSLSDKVSIETAFMYENEFNTKKPKDARIYLIGLSFEL